MNDILKSLEFSIKAETKDFSGETVELLPMENDESRYLFKAFFDDGSERAMVSVELLTDGDTACFYVEAELKEGASYDIRRYFFPYESVKLRLKPKKKADAAMGCYYYIEDKSDCWSKEFFCEDIVNAPKRTAALIWKQGNMNFELLPLCDGDFKGEIGGNGEELELTLSPYTGGYGKICGRAAVLSQSEDI